MKIIFTIATFICWSMLSRASDIRISSEFIKPADETYLKCMNKVLFINFSNAVISEIGSDFISSPLITCLDLENNNIRRIAEDAFSKLPNLTNLYLSNNEIDSSRNLFTFGGHQTLKILVLNSAVTREEYYYNSQNIVEIPGVYPNLETLSVHQNGFYDLTLPANSNLSSLSTQIAPFPKLKTLDLSGNNIIGINFINLLPKSLQRLYLEDNSLDSIHLMLGNLLVLMLDNNNFISVMRYSNRPGALNLANLKNLYHLSISRNKISNIESTAFHDTRKLVYLNLSMNEIDDLFPETFVNLLSLKTLDLNSNKLQRVPETFNKLNITILSLSFNKIKNITKHAFAWTPQLKKLSLNENQIDDIDVNGFSDLYYLEELDLSSNKLSSLPKGWTAAFRSLKHLDLSDNQFASLEALSLRNRLPLVEVYLEMYPLKYLDARSFDSLPQNVTVFLVHTPHKVSD